MMERYVSKDGKVLKYIHDNGAETAVKNVSSCGNVVDPDTGALKPVEIERNKYSVFVSSSVGCPVGCKFCYLTVKKYPYHPLSPEEIVGNTIAAIEDAVERMPELREKDVKLSWMGMGDVFTLNPYLVRAMTKQMLNTIFANQMASGLDGVDVGTSFPSVRTDWVKHLRSFKQATQNGFYKYLPGWTTRDPVRLFFSLHAPSKIRGLLIPNGEDLARRLKMLSSVGVDTILHMLLLKGVNDSEQTCLTLCRLINKWLPDAELRILRYNKCPGSPFDETDHFDDRVKLFHNNLRRVKYQISAGSEIQAACGQFICKDFS